MHNLVYLTQFLATIAGVMFIYGLDARQVLPTGIRPGRDMPLWAFVVFGLGLLVFESVSVVASVPSDTFWDFLNAYYLAGKAAWHNDHGLLRDLIGRGHTGFVNIPIVAYALAPLGALPPLLAALVMTIVGLALTLATWFMLVRLARLEVREQWLLGFLFLANGPLINGIKWGNLSYYILPALAGGLLLLRMGRSGWAGVLLGLAAVIKPPLALFGIFFLLRRDWRGLFGFACVGLLTILASLVVFGWADNLYWFEHCIVGYSQNWLATAAVQSVCAFILRFEAGARMVGFFPQAPSQGQKLLAQLITLAIFLFAALAAMRPFTPGKDLTEADKELRRDLQYLLILCVCLISSPLNWAHYYAWLLIPTAYFLAAQARASFPRGARRVGWAAIAMVTPLVGLAWTGPQGPLMVLYRCLFVSHLFIGGLLFVGLVGWWLAHTGGLLTTKDQAQHDTHIRFRPFANWITPK